MRRWRILLLTITAGLALGNSGCFINQYPSDRNQRMDVLLNESEDMRQIRQERRRWWMNGQASCLSYERLNGHIGPD